MEYLSSKKPYLSVTNPFDNISDKLQSRKKEQNNQSTFGGNFLKIGSSIINGITSGLNAKSLIKQKEDQRVEMFEKAKQYAKLQNNINRQIFNNTSILQNNYNNFSY